MTSTKDFAGHPALLTSGRTDFDPHMILLRKELKS